MSSDFVDSRAWPALVAVILAGVLIWALQPILTPFLVGALLAYLGNPVANRLERTGTGRTLGVVMVFALFIAVGLAAIMLLVPMLGNQIAELRARLPGFIEWLQQTARPWLEARLATEFPDWDMNSLRAAVTTHWQSTGGIAATILARITESGLALAGALLNAALIPVVTFYLMRDWDALLERIRGLLPRRSEATVSALARECDEVVSAFLRGQLLVMLALGVVYTLGLWLVGLNLALLIGMVAGLASVVPYLGVIVGVGSAVLATLFQFPEPWLPLLLVAGVFIVGQLLESVVLTPLLVGERIGLHPVAVIFAVLAGGQLFGFTGVLLALPVAAVIMVLVRHAGRRYRSSRLYSDASRGTTATTASEARPPTRWG